jgi:hypothetical protein
LYNNIFQFDNIMNITKEYKIYINNNEDEYYIVEDDAIYNFEKQIENTNVYEDEINDFNKITEIITQKITCEIGINTEYIKTLCDKSTNTDIHYNNNNNNNNNQSKNILSCICVIS